MSKSFLIALLALCVASASADSALPDGWLAGVTGPGNPQWVVRADGAVHHNVLVQTGEGYYPWCVRRDVSIGDGFVAVTLKPISGNEDQAGGVVWRWKDGDNYYVARANALEDNVALYYVSSGTRHLIESVRVPVSSNAWHKLRVDYAGQRIKVALDGRTYIEREDHHLTEAGAVGVWTKADSVTAFDDFSYGAVTTGKP